MNPDWRFVKQDVASAHLPSFDDSAWTTVSVPHTFNDVDSFDNYIGSSGESAVAMQPMWYRKRFTLPAEHAGQKVLLEFEGVRQAATVYVNGTKVGLYENGVAPFGFDITDQVRFGAENVIAVKADNTKWRPEESTGMPFQWDTRDFNPTYGGLTRNVRMYVLPKTYFTLPLYTNLRTTGTYVYASAVNVARRDRDGHRRGPGPQRADHRPHDHRLRERHPAQRHGARHDHRLAGHPGRRRDPDRQALAADQRARPLGAGPAVPLHGGDGALRGRCGAGRVPGHHRLPQDRVPRRHDQRRRLHQRQVRLPHRLRDPGHQRVGRHRRRRAGVDDRPRRAADPGQQREPDPLDARRRLAGQHPDDRPVRHRVDPAGGGQGEGRRPAGSGTSGSSSCGT